MRRLLLTTAFMLIVAAATAQQQTPAADGISVLGQVKMPGIYRVTTDHPSLAQAIALAQGLTDRADVTSVTITRNGMTVHIDFGRVLSGTLSDIVLKAGDVIRVPEVAK